MIHSYILNQRSRRAIDIDQLPVTVWLGGRGVALVTADNSTVTLLKTAGYDVMVAFDGYMTCGRRTVLVQRPGAIPVVVLEADDEIWCLDCFIAECKIVQHNC